MTPEKENRIFEVYGITQPDLVTLSSGYSNDYSKEQNHLRNNSQSMLIKLWEIWETVGVYDDNNLESFLSSIHPEKLPFEEIERSVTQ